MITICNTNLIGAIIMLIGVIIILIVGLYPFNCKKNKKNKKHR
jgi:hypothetical protein